MNLARPDVLNDHSVRSHSPLDTTKCDIFNHILALDPDRRRRHFVAMSQRARTVELGRRIARARTSRGMSQAALARAVNQSQSAISFWEKGEREPTRDMVARIASELQVSLEELEPASSGDASDTVAVVGFVSAGAAVDLYAEGQGPFDTVPAPRFRTDTTVAVAVRGVSLGPAFDESILFYDDVRSPVTDDLIGRLCVVGLTDGRVLVKVLKRGEDGRFHLLSNTAEEPLWNEEIIWAARVTEVRPR